MAERFPYPQQNFQQHMPIPLHNPGGSVLHYPGAPLWQQQQQQRQQQLLEDQKHREYVKQQQKLRLITSSANKTVSADKLIENLLEKKETFQLKPHANANASHNQMTVHPAGMTNTLSLPSTYVAGSSTPPSVPFVSHTIHDGQKCPTWLTTCSNNLPPMYSHVWSLVAGPNGLADTGRLFPILITSGLTADVLGHIWSLANKEVPGQLTELELYAVLALIALAQAVDHQINEWCRCVQSCLNLLQAALNLFSSVTSEEVLEEVLHIGEGKDYLNNLLEVRGVCQRVKQAFKLTFAESKKLESLLCEVDQVWDGLRTYYYKADISVQQELPSLDVADDPVCGICLTAMEGGRGNTSALEYGGQLYHAACANLWVNCVDCSLPSLANSML